MHTPLAIVYRPVAELRQNPLNPRIHPASKIAYLAYMIYRTRFFDPIKVDEHGNVLDGHARLEVAKLLGLRLVPTMCLRLDPEAKAMLSIIGNALAHMAVWDGELLASLRAALI